MQLPPAMMKEKTNQIFKLTRQKLKIKLVAKKVDARLRQIAAEKEANLRWELMIKEFEDRMAAAIAATAAPMAVP